MSAASTPPPPQRASASTTCSTAAAAQRLRRTHSKRAVRAAAVARVAITVDRALARKGNKRHLEERGKRTNFELVSGLEFVCIVSKPLLTLEPTELNKSELPIKFWHNFAKIRSFQMKRTLCESFLASDDRKSPAMKASYDIKSGKTVPGRSPVEDDGTTLASLKVTGAREWAAARWSSSSHNLPVPVGPSVPRKRGSEFRRRLPHRLHRSYVRRMRLQLLHLVVWANMRSVRKEE